MFTISLVFVSIVYNVSCLYFYHKSCLHAYNNSCLHVSKQYTTSLVYMFTIKTVYMSKNLLSPCLLYILSSSQIISFLVWLQSLLALSRYFVSPSRCLPHFFQISTISLVQMSTIYHSTCLPCLFVYLTFIYLYFLLLILNPCLHYQYVHQPLCMICISQMLEITLI